MRSVRHEIRSAATRLFSRETSSSIVSKLHSHDRKLHARATSAVGFDSTKCAPSDWRKASGEHQSLVQFKCEIPDSLNGQTRSFAGCQNLARNSGRSSETS